MEEKESVYLIEVEKIKPNPYQPRSDFDEQALKELADSVREYGILEPLLVTRKEIYRERQAEGPERAKDPFRAEGPERVENPEKVEIYYELIAGERRLEAAKLVGFKVVPAIIRIVSERGKLEIALIENLQRKDLNPLEKAKGFARLIEEFQLTQREVAYKLGKSREYVTNVLRLLKLPEKIQVAIRQGIVTESQARILLTIEDMEIQNQLFEEVISERLTVRDTQERLQRRLAQRAKPKEKGGEENLAYDEFEHRLEEALGTKVKIQKTQGGLKLEIDLYSDDELEKIVEMINKNKTISGEFDSRAPASKETNNEESDEVLRMLVKKLDLFEE